MGKLKKMRDIPILNKKPSYYNNVLMFQLIDFQFFNTKIL